MTDTVRSETAGAGNTLRVLVYAALIVAAVWFLLPMFVMIITIGVFGPRTRHLALEEISR